ncbi:MAG TPA: FKBP-type peptidyl-prolyl cis-trans isomerase [Acidiferrobacterales bacterium]|nr:FKBP-type peptidyl-prolyl cis-trans isomerase [Acidiferrobacterales bacterium]
MNVKFLGIIVGCLFAMQVVADDKLTLKTEKEKLSYSLGANLGQNVKNNNLDIDAEIFARAIKDALTGNKPLLSDEEMKTALQEFQQKMRQKQVAMLQETAAKNKKEGEAFLAANKKKKDVVVLPSGLQYKVIKAGAGKKPTINDTVIAHYTGALINGKEFDSSIRRGEPATFPLGGVIKGWQEVLPLMQTGAKWQVFIPADLAYGETGAGQAIGPNETLVFEIELISIKEPPK